MSSLSRTAAGMAVAVAIAFSTLPAWAMGSGSSDDAADKYKPGRAAVVNREDGALDRARRMLAP